LYYRLKAHMVDLLNGIIANSDQHTDEGLLVFYSKQWSTYLQSARILNSLFQYLNRMWIKRSLEEIVLNVYEVYTTCLQVWKDHFFIPLQERLIPSLLQMVLKDRKGETIDNALISKITNSFVMFGIDAIESRANSLDIYQRHFEGEFIVATQVFYRAESESFIGANPVTEYLKVVCFESMFIFVGRNVVS
jgi:cullin 1